MPPLTEHSIQTTILDDSGRRDCYACAEIDWSLPETVALARQRIKDRFSHDIKLEYYDLSEAAANQQTLEWSQLIRDKNLSVPLLLINGELRISGQFDIRQLLDAIEADIEIGARR